MLFFKIVVNSWLYQQQGWQIPVTIVSSVMYLNLPFVWQLLPICTILCLAITMAAGMLRPGPVFCLARSNLRLCSANHRAGYFSNLACDWLSIVWAYSEQETENGPWWCWAIGSVGYLIRHDFLLLLYMIDFFSNTNLIIEQLASK